MGVKFIKIRFNTNNPDDQAVLDILKRVDGQNAFIKRAIIAYDEKQQNEQLIKSIVNAVRSALSNMQFETSSVSVKKDEVTDKDNFEESADIADEFLDSL